MYNYYATSFSYHRFHMFIIMSKPLKIKILIPFTILFHINLHSYNNFFSSSEGVSKGLKHSFTILTLKNLNKILVT